MTKITIVLMGVGILISGAVAMILIKKISPVSWGLYGKVNAPNGVAINGYDTVAYHKAGKPIPGSDKFVAVHDGVTWQFSSAENKAEFVRSPAKYTPAYGGFCGFAASKGFTAKTDPSAWRIEKSQLYLFNDEGMRDKWISELENDVIGRGMENWAKRKL